MAAEDPRKMAVVREPAFQPNLGDLKIRHDELLAGFFDPEAPHVLAERTAVHPTKAPGEVNRMNAPDSCDFHK